MTQLIANFFYDNSGSINATFTDTLGATGSISESAGYNGINAFYGLTDVEYESVKVYTGSCELQPIVTGSGFVIGSDVYNLFSYSPDGRRFSKKFLSLPTTVTKIGTDNYQYSDFSTSSYALQTGVYGDGTLIMWGTNCLCISDDLGKTWRYTVTPSYAARLDNDDDYINMSIACGAYGNGTFVLVDGNFTKFYSTDKGYTWHISEGSVKPSENFNFDKIDSDQYGTSQLIFDGSRFIQCGPHYERDRDGEIYRVSFGRYSYDGIIWHQFLPQSGFLVDVETKGHTEKACNIRIRQLFTNGTSSYALTELMTNITPDEYPYYNSEYHIRKIYSSSIANDTSVVSMSATDMLDSVYGLWDSCVQGGTNDTIYIPGFISSSNNIDYHYLQKFNPSSNSISLFKYYELDRNDVDYNNPATPTNVKTSIVGYNRDLNTFVLGDNYNEEIATPIFNITDNTDVNISRMAIVKYPMGFYGSSTHTQTFIPIVSSILSGSIPPTSSATPPDNQYFASASLISSLYFTVSGSNENAATESIDPQMSASATIWFKWTPTDATGSSIYSITTLGSDFDTVLYLFELSGSESPENLVHLEWNDDYNGFTSNIDTIITGSKTYYICVGGHNGDQGNYILSSSYVNPPPANDSYEGAYIMGGNSGVITGSNRYATTEVIDGDTHYSGVWWKWSPSVTKTATINPSGSGFPLEVYVYTKTEDVFNFVTYASEYSRNFSIQSGSTYYFVIGGQGSGKSYQGDIRLSYT